MHATDDGLERGQVEKWMDAFEQVQAILHLSLDGGGDRRMTRRKRLLHSQVLWCAGRAVMGTWVSGYVCANE